MRKHIKFGISPWAKPASIGTTPLLHYSGLYQLGQDGEASQCWHKPYNSHNGSTSCVPSLVKAGRKHLHHANSRPKHAYANMQAPLQQTSHAAGSALTDVQELAIQVSTLLRVPSLYGVLAFGHVHP